MTTENQNDTNERSWVVVQRHRGWLIVGAVVVSLLVHAVSVVELGRHERDRNALNLNLNLHQPVKVRIVEVPKPPKKPEEKRDDELDKRILETPQQKTEPAEDAKFAGNVDHKAKQEMRLPEQMKREKALDPGQKGNPDAKPEQQVAQEKHEEKRAEATPKQNEIKIKDKKGNLSIGEFTPDRKPRNNYEALLPTSVADLPGQISAGYQDFVDDKVAEGDRIDISTAEYRYIGYFTTMRKAIELVWTYPGEASRRHMQGEVGLEFAINKDGRASQIRVLKSSGFPILDRAIVEAIKLASPFSPLPDGFRKDKLIVTGSFRYILSAYGSH